MGRVLANGCKHQGDVYPYLASEPCISENGQLVSLDVSMRPTCNSDPNPVQKRGLQPEK